MIGDDQREFFRLLAPICSRMRRATPSYEGFSMTPSGKAHAARGLHILLAEDEELIAELLAETLAEDGHDVSVVGDGQQALDRFAEAEAVGHPYDVVVTDVRMPRMDGVTLTRRLRAARPELPVVLVSGYASPEQLSALSGVENPSPVLLPKPVSLSRLRTVVRRATQH
jgi:CheY-like chemotaxis protein